MRDGDRSEKLRLQSVWSGYLLKLLLRLQYARPCWEGFVVQCSVWNGGGGAAT